MNDWLPGQMPETVIGLGEHIVMYSEEVCGALSFFYVLQVVHNSYSINVARRKEERKEGKERGREGVNILGS